MPDAERRRERHNRIRWTKRLLRPLPRRATLHRYPVLKWFAEAARRRAYLWSFRVNDMTPAFYLGSVIALLPIMGIQIPVAFVTALVLRLNLPAIVGLQMITNLVTAAPIYYATTQVGRFIIELVGLHTPESRVALAASSSVVGGMVCGVILGGTLDLVYRLLAHEARKHHWHLPRRPHRKESASPDDDSGHNQ